MQLVQQHKKESLTIGVLAKSDLAHDPRHKQRNKVRRDNPWVVLAALLMIYVSNQWSRILPSYLVAFDAAGQAVGWSLLIQPRLLRRGTPGVIIATLARLIQPAGYASWIPSE